jgi:hypothetical protein
LGAAASARGRRARKRLFRVDGASDATAGIAGRVSFIRHSLDEPWNGASSSILPGSEEGIGGRHGFAGTLAAADV